MNLFEFSKEIRQFNLDQNHQELLKYFKNFKSRFSKEDIGANDYIVRDVLEALIQTHQVQYLFHFIQTFQVHLSTYNYIYLLKKLKEKKHWDIIVPYCEMINYKSLDQKVFTIDKNLKGQNKTLELASNYEEWLSVYTKALFELEQYEKCIEFSQIGLDTVEKYHYSNDIWWYRRIALSRKALNQLDIAIEDFLKILKKKKDGFLSAEIAEMYLEKNDLVAAKKYALQALSATSPIEFKIQTIDLMKRIYIIENDFMNAYKYCLLNVTIRQEQNWKISKQTYETLKDLHARNLNVQIDAAQNKKELINSWKKSKTHHSEKKYFGHIVKILHQNENGVDGFIKCVEIGNVYFRCSGRNDVQELEIGKKLEFQIVPSSKDPQKNMAIKIKVCA